MLKQVDIDIDSGGDNDTNASDDTTPRDRPSIEITTPKTTALTPVNLDTLVEQSPTDSEFRDPLGMALNNKNTNIDVGIEFTAHTNSSSSNDDGSQNHQASEPSNQSSEPSNIPSENSDVEHPSITLQTQEEKEDHDKLSETLSAPLPEKTPTEENAPLVNVEESSKPNQEESTPNATAEESLKEENEKVIAEESIPRMVEGEEVEAKPSLKVGDVVKIAENLEGQVRFYGRTQFADGIWVGIALTVAEG